MSPFEKDTQLVYKNSRCMDKATQARVSDVIH